MWANYRALGYHRMIYTNTASVLPDVIEHLTTAMGDNPRVVAVLLTCTDATARDRLSQREIGSTLAQHVASSSKSASVLETGTPEGTGEFQPTVAPVPEVANDIIDATGWLHSG